MSESDPGSTELEADAGTAPTEDDRLRRVLDMDARKRPAALAQGQVIDEAYRIERALGAGGMGIVYLARDLRLHRDVAIKLHVASSGPSRERLMREAAAMAQLRHGNVVTVYEVGEWAGHPYVAMEYVPGQTLRAWLAASPRPPGEIVAAFVSAARGLAAAHAAGLVHRDFKPDNVLVGDDGRVHVADFGLARGFGDEVIAASAAEAAPQRLELTATGAAVGTPAYMAPEQRRGGAVGPAADQFAFAVALWEALFGHRPFAGDTAAAIARAIEAGDLRTPPTKAAPPSVHRALVRALAADPEARFPSMTAMIDALAVRPRRRGAFAVAAVAGIAALGAGAWWLRRDPPAAAPPVIDAVDNAQALDAARDALARDPDAALAALSRLDPRGDGWGAARTIAAAAATRPRLVVRVDDLPRVADVAIRRDHRYAAVGGEDGGLIVDLSTGEVRRVQGWYLDGMVHLYCADGSLVWEATSSAGARSFVRVDVETAAVTPVASATEAEQIALFGACSGMTAVVDDSDRLLRFDLARGTLETVPAPRDLHAVVEPVDGVHALLQSDATLERWTGADRTERVPIERGFEVTAASDDRRWVLRNGDALEVLDLTTGARRRLAAHASVATISADGSTVAALIEAKVVIVDVASGAERAWLPTGYLGELQLSADGRQLIAVGATTALWRTDGALGAQVLAARADGRAWIEPQRALVLDPDARSLSIWSWPELDVEALPGGPVIRAAWSVDDRWVAGASQAHLWRRELAGAAPAEETSIGGKPISLAVDPHGDIVVALEGGAIVVWRRGQAPVEVGQVPPQTSRLGERTLDHGIAQVSAPLDLAPLASVAWSPDGVPMSWDGRALVLWDAAGPTTIPTPTWPGEDAEQSQLQPPVVSPTGQIALGRCSDCLVRLVDLSTGRVRILVGAYGEAAAFSPDGTALVARSWPGAVIWDLGASRFAPVPGSARFPDELAFDLTGDRVALATPAGLTLVTRSRHAAQDLSSNHTRFTEVAFSPDGAELVGLTQGSLVAIWDVASLERREVSALDIVSVRPTRDALRVVTANALITIPDDLPRDPAALLERIRTATRTR